jgi:hypothetical protein
VSDLFGKAGRELLDEAPLDPVCRARGDALCRLIDASDFEIELAAGRLAGDDRYHAIQALPGVCAHGPG